MRSRSIVKYGLLVLPARASVVSMVKVNMALSANRTQVHLLIAIIMSVA